MVGNASKIAQQGVAVKKRERDREHRDDNSFFRLRKWIRSQPSEFRMLTTEPGWQFRLKKNPTQTIHDEQYIKSNRKGKLFCRNQPKSSGQSRWCLAARSRTFVIGKCTVYCLNKCQHEQSDGGEDRYDHPSVGAELALELRVRYTDISFMMLDHLFR